MFKLSTKLVRAKSYLNPQSSRVSYHSHWGYELL